MYSTLQKYNISARTSDINLQPPHHVDEIGETQERHPIFIAFGKTRFEMAFIVYIIECCRLALVSREVVKEKYQQIVNLTILNLE